MKLVTKKNVPIDESWLTTYSDLVTLLLCFFVLLVSMSTTNTGMWQEFKEGYRAEIEANEEDFSTPLSRMKADLDSMLLEERMAGIVSVRLNRSSIAINILSDALYRSGEATIIKKNIGILQKIATSISSIKYYDPKIDIEGHTDDVPINTRRFPSNWELSVGRASNIVRYFIENGISPERMKAAGYAYIKPLAPNKDPKGKPIQANRDLNRRIVIEIH